MLQYLSNDFEYHELDFNKKYIELARNEFGDRGKFYIEKVGDIVRVEWLETFDIVNANGILHHLRDSECKLLIDLAYRYLKKGGKLVTFDPTYHDSQSLFSNKLVSLDRGQNVRYTDTYLKLASSIFDNEDGKLIHILPFSLNLMVCQKK